MIEKLSGALIVGIITAYLIAPQVVAGAIWETALAFVTYWN